ncbi:MAG: NAD(+)/NADH kinase [Methylacidiphilales bacterium]|nr:NAD(+)/NADH kinase [Candidatus Methylacidiphilales bacterium]
MRKKIARVTIWANENKPPAREVAGLVESILKKHRVACDRVGNAYEDPDTIGAIGDLRRQKSDLILVIGGDGTLLHAARRIQGSKTPLLGINAGTLGFLTSLPREGVVEALPRILRGEYYVTERIALSVRVVRDDKTFYTGWALNEGVITRGGHSHMVRLDVRINGEYLTTYLCDGLIIATPTGSTAYSLSAGGPIITPNAEAFLLNPLCAHALTNRPLVVDAGSPIFIEIPNDSPVLDLETDGLNCLRLHPKDRVEFSKAKGATRLAWLPETNFYTVLRQKLRWSGTSI